MDLINNLMPTKVDDRYLREKELNNKVAAIDKWHFNDKVYAKIYFKDYDVGYTYLDGRNNQDSKFVICKSKFFHRFRELVFTSYYYITEFYTEKDFKFNSIWEGIYTNE